MPTANEVIRDLEIRHQVGVHRLSSGVLRTLIRILDAADADIVAELLKRGVALEGSFTSKRLEALLAAIRDINHEAHVTVGRDLRQELRDIVRYEASFQKRMLETAIPIQWDIVTPTAEVLDAVVTSRPFQGRLLKDWLTELEAGKANRVRNAVRLGVVQGETVDQIVRRVRGTAALNYKDGAMEIGRRGAEAMVRTAVSHTTTAARDTLFEANADIIASEMWTSTLDTRTCPSCQALDGQKFEIGKGPKTPLHIGCRCIRVPVTKSWRELGIDIDDLPAGTRASMNGQVPASMRYDEWLRTQSWDAQDEALGPTRAALFRDGGLTVDRFTGRDGDHLTLDELRRRENAAFEKAGIAA
jgi:SPP1 gp7 family putative phage head morphogenesis protein